MDEQVAGKACRLQELRPDNRGARPEPVSKRTRRDGRGDPHKSCDRQAQPDACQRQGRGRQEEQQREGNEDAGSDSVDEEGASQPWLAGGRFRRTGFFLPRWFSCMRRSASQGPREGRN